jgi:hypothetical protein
VSDHLITRALLLALLCAEAQAAECAFPTSPRALNGTNNAQDYKFVHISCSDQLAGGKWLINNFILNTHSSSILPIAWTNGMIVFQNIRHGACASSSIESFFVPTEDRNSPVCYGINSRLTKPAHAWVLEQDKGMGMFWDGRLESRLSAHLLDGKTPLDLQLVFASTKQTTTYSYVISNFTFAPITVDMSDFVREWKRVGTKGPRWIRGKEPETNFQLKSDWTASYTGSSEYEPMQSLNWVRLRSLDTGEIIGSVRVPFLLPASK